jgi:hypothetical protein
VERKKPLCFSRLTHNFVRITATTSDRGNGTYSV